MSSGGGRLRLGVVLDAALEGWTSMDYCGEMLVESLRREHGDAVDVTPIRPRAPQLFGRLPGAAHWLGWSMDRFATRCFYYPAAIARSRNRFDAFHIVDHSYAHVAHVLPPQRTGIYCHDIDALEPLLGGAPVGAPWKYALGHSILKALQRAAIVFFSTDQIRQRIVHYGLLDERKLVHAPLGVAPEFQYAPPANERLVNGAPNGAFILHIGSNAPRKRIDLLLRAFAQARTERRDLVLVQVGARLTAAHQRLISRLGIADAVIQPRRLSRVELAQFYRRADLVLLPSEREGFGLPVIEALACGATVLCSDIPAFREVGGASVAYLSGDNPAEWGGRILELLSGIQPFPPRDDRLRQASRFTWSRHAQVIARAYQGLA